MFQNFSKKGAVAFLKQTHLEKIFNGLANWLLPLNSSKNGWKCRDSNRGLQVEKRNRNLWALLASKIAKTFIWREPWKKNWGHPFLLSPVPLNELLQLQFYFKTNGLALSPRMTITLQATQWRWFIGKTFCLLAFIWPIKTLKNCEQDWKYKKITQRES